jgi:nucleoside-diphosphate-sugar epimerase
MVVLITGSNSSLGKKLVDVLSKKYKILGSFNKKAHVIKKNKNISFKKINLEKEIKIKKSYKVKCVVHIASRVPSDGNDYKNYDRNIRMTKNILKFIKKNKIKRLIFFSTMSVYGNHKKKIIKESYTSQIDPTKLDYYARAKLDSEKLFLNYANKNKNFILTIYRLCGIVGKNSKNNFLSNTLDKIKKNKLIYISNPNCLFNNVITNHNIAQILLKSIDFEKRNSIYNLASKKPKVLKDVIKKIFIGLNKKVNISIVKSKKPFLISLKKKLIKNYNIYTVDKSIKQFINENLE